MTSWSALTGAAPIDVPAKPSAGVWTKAIDYVEGGTILKLEVGTANSSWHYGDEDQCGPDGDVASIVLRSKCLLASAPVGALIGKIGGSTAGSADGAVFVVGSFCIVKVGADGGPLYLTINDQENGMSNNRDTMNVTVSRAM
jgi:hypothetical protein